MKDLPAVHMDSANLREIRDWRGRERKKTVEEIDRLIAHAVRLAESRWTRSTARAKWVRLAGQLLWYKDQIMRSMTWEALEIDMQELIKQVEEQDRDKRDKLPSWQNLQTKTLPANVGAKKPGEDDENAGNNTRSETPVP